jgi:hypothetical protein
MGKKIKKLVSKTIGGKAGLFGDLSDDAEKDAKQQAELTRQQQEQQRMQLQTTQDNMAADLRGENLANVVAGGSADQFSVSTDPTKKRRVGGLTAALGGL